MKPTQSFCGCHRRVNPKPSFFRWYANLIKHIVTWHLIHMTFYRLYEKLMSIYSPLESQRINWETTIKKFIDEDRCHCELCVSMLFVKKITLKQKVLLKLLKPIITIVYLIQLPGRRYGASWIDNYDL